MASRSQASRIILGISSFVIHVLLNILFYVIVVMLITKYSGVAYDFAYQVFGEVSYVEAGEHVKDVTITIQKGESTMSVARKLVMNRVIENEYSFYLRAKLFQSNIKTGKYKVNASMTYGEILDVISNYDNNLDKDSDNLDKDSEKDADGQKKTSSNTNKKNTN
ncbi:endolytic transglycosylase MltG [Anaerosporobacter sp.]|uniref:endolytic transglycosylase MltG n=1 Tax=Anaerosporobacter sp. TaxID=1872529 RepID=UPI00286ED8CB|nr:endolytic transglycosylase MltG [Anaerosporobacter sp.]